ncbi:unnamed protein product [Candida verbasci]|uniref:CFEM domain-containing protein n=1 Tax=Candida verbasci TaxID=1227364 RepID=A0A9W4XI11_9ASCO|nr:unnamed protein product [Candida verbasci]
MNLILFLFIALVSADNYATYPQVPKTASINGFADPIYALLPECAKECVKYSTGNTPCPYWDTGCFCVMPQWSGMVGQCFAQSCSGEDVASATYLANSLCSTVGANTWMMPASISTMLSSAAGNAREVTTIEGQTPMSWVIGPGSSVATETGDSTENAEETGEANTTSSSSSTNSASSSSTTQNSTSNVGIIQTASVGTIILGFLLSFLL